MRPGSTRIVLYAFNYSSAVLRDVPYMQYSAERSLCYLSDLRHGEKNLIIVTPTPVDPYVLEYHYRDLYQFNDQQVKSANERLTLLSPRAAGPQPLDALVLADDELMRWLKEEVHSGREMSIANFAASPHVAQIASALGLHPEESSSAISAHYHGKFGGRELLRRSGVPIPPGDARLLRDEAAVVAAIRQLTSGARPARQVVIKLDDPSWSGAVGNAVVDCARLARIGNLRESVEFVRQPWNDFAQEIYRTGVIAEEYIQGVTSSPSGMGQVTADGTVKVLATHDQILSSGQFCGCRFPANQKWRGEITHAVERVGQTLAECGVQGMFGIDFVTSATGELFAVEVNLRKVGPSHVLSYVESLSGASVDLQGMLRRDRDGSAVHYLHRRMLAPETLRGEQPRAVVDRLRDAGLLYQPDTGEGVILHVLGGLSACGYVELTNVASTAEAATAINEAAQATMVCRH